MALKVLSFLSWDVLIDSDVCIISSLKSGQSLLQNLVYARYLEPSVSIKRKPIVCVFLFGALKMRASTLEDSEVVRPPFLQIRASDLMAAFFELVDDFHDYRC
ncbi:hypothetical protein M0R45_012831 [Rubus argutus]|uniref:Uncharacterized protein n=1 Tax=Rubus argutus TaxID=59490 RepID=A0AAW1XI18_RUBAR